MSEVLHANIFFFITGIAVIVFTMLLCIVLYHVIKILKSVRKVIDRIEAGSEVIAEDLQSFRAYFAEQSIIARVIRAMMGNSRTAGSSVKRPASSPKKEVRKIAKTELKINDED